MSKNIEARIQARHLAAAMVIAAKDDIRYYLNGVCIEPAPDGGILLVSTDGHRLLVIHDPDGFASEQFILPRNPDLIRVCNKSSLPNGSQRDMKRVSRIVVRGGLAYAVNNCFDLESPEFDPTTTNCAWPFNPIDGRFADWRRVLAESDNENDEGKKSFSVNPKYFGDFEVVKKHLGGTWGVVLHTGKNQDKTYVEIPANQDMRAFGVVMHSRSEVVEGGKGFLPSWVSSLKAEAA
ncbi:MAG: hypothetical protein CMN85_10435 [Spongiibacteraceae bacterium]|nr:hypothetical protein [Spongiibacteraceae bacterium]|tara:strand:+ start:3970 stop:4677 length:708 start_codon:yes stop_codon:yes gene_type:complete